MSNHDMPGNDYVAMAKFRLEGVHDQQSDEGLTEVTLIAAAMDAQTQATLAAAYELRTANLIAMQALGVTDMSDWHPDHAAGWIKRAKEIGERTGGEK